MRCHTLQTYLGTQFFMSNIILLIIGLTISGWSKAFGQIEFETEQIPTVNEFLSGPLAIFMPLAGAKAHFKESHTTTQENPRKLSC